MADKQVRRRSSLTDLNKTQRKKLQALSWSHEWASTAGVLNVMLTVAIAVRFPALYWIWHLGRTVFYIPTRYMRFRKIKSELYLLDWCYVVTHLSNVCAVLAFARVAFGISTPLAKYNADLIHAGFAMASGPLACSVYVFKNSLVFHDVDHSTSVFIHLSPFVLFWCLRWGAGNPSIIHETLPTMFRVCASEEEFAAADACLRSWQGALWCNACSATLRDFVVPPALLYVFVWSVPYFLVIFVWKSDWVKRTKRETLYSYFVETQPELHAAMEQRLEALVGLRYAGPTGYMLLHSLLNLVTGATSYLLWHSFLLHNLVLLFVIVCAVHNGSTFMFRVFAYRYVEEQLQKHQSVLE